MKDNEEKMNFELVTPSGLAISNIIDGDDRIVKGTKWVKWGKENKFPAILWDNYLKCSNLQAIVNTICDYIVGQGIVSDYSFLSDDDETIEEVIKKCVLDYILFGGFAVECIRNSQGDIVRVNYQNVMNVRINEALTTAYLSNKWSTYTNTNVIELPLFDKNEVQPHFIYYYRGNITRGINPVPCYVSALKSVEILNNTRNFHLRNLENNFSASAIINLNNGDISTRELKEIKDKIEKGYCGSENAGRFMIINGGDKDHAATIERLNADNFGDLYKSLSESSVDDLYVAFRLNKILVGSNVATGFSKEEFQNAYELYNETMIVPLQNNIKKAMAKIGITIDFKPFVVNWASE